MFRTSLGVGRAAPILAGPSFNSEILGGTLCIFLGKFFFGERSPVGDISCASFFCWVSVASLLIKALTDVRKAMGF